MGQMATSWPEGGADSDSVSASHLIRYVPQVAIELTAQISIFNDLEVSRCMKI